MTASPDLAARLVAGAQRGSLVLTLDETRHLLADVHPRASVQVDDRTVYLADLPVFVIDNLNPFGNLDDNPWHRQLLASFAEGLIDADDVERLWNPPASSSA